MFRKLICRLFGHAPLTHAGYMGGTGYARLRTEIVDGMNNCHLYLDAECPRCGKMYRICNYNIGRR